MHPTESIHTSGPTVVGFLKLLVLDVDQLLGAHREATTKSPQPTGSYSLDDRYVRTAGTVHSLLTQGDHCMLRRAGAKPR